MEYITVYEIENIFFPYMIFIPLLLLIIFVFLSYKSYKLKENIVLSIILSIATIFMTTLCVSHIYEFKNLKTNILDSYIKGNYETVEGTVQGFEPLPLNGNGTESFTVNGIQFRYSNSALSYIGYKTTAAEGGYITKNGQNVRIGYIYDDTYENNIILKLDIEKS
jgi:hypothetical protein